MDATVTIKRVLREDGAVPLNDDLDIHGLVQHTFHIYDNLTAVNLGSAEDVTFNEPGGAETEPQLVPPAGEAPTSEGDVQRQDEIDEVEPYNDLLAMDAFV